MSSKLIAFVPFFAFIIWLYIPIINFFLLPNSHLQGKEFTNFALEPRLFNLTSDQLKAYEEDGLILIKDFLQEDARELLRKAAQGYVENPTFQGELAKFVGPPPLAKTLMVIPWPSFVIDTSFLELMVRVPSGHVTHQLIKTDEVVLVKPTLIGGNHLKTHWHIDYNFMPHEDKENMENCREYMVFWMPAHDCGKDCPGIQFLKGSHKFVQKQNVKWVGDLIWNVEKVMEDMLAKGHGELFIPEFKLGDAVIFNQCIFHSTKSTDNDNTRASYQMRMGPRFDNRGKVPEKMKRWPGIFQDEKNLMLDVWPSFPNEAPSNQDHNLETLTSKFVIFKSWLCMPIWVTGSAVKMRFGPKVSFPLFVLSIIGRKLFGFFI